MRYLYIAMSKITEIKQSVNTRIRVKSNPNSVTTSDVSDNLDLIADEVRSRGIIKAVNTAGLSAISGNNTKYALVTSVGVFEYSPTGVADGQTIFAAEGSGTWNLIFGMPQQNVDKFTINTDYEYNFSSTEQIDQIILKPSVDQTMKAGFTDGGEDVLLEELLIGDLRKTIIMKIYGDENPTIYFNGAMANVEVTIFKSKI